MTTKVLELEDLEKLIEGLKNIPEIARPLIEDAMTESLSLLHDALAEYPPESEANHPGRLNPLTGRAMPYYERGQGTWYPVYKEQTMTQAIATADGKKGKRAGIIKMKKAAMLGYKLRRSSETLGKKWTSNVVSNDNGVLGRIGTTVSYADYVQGAQQAEFHNARGWKTIYQVLDETQSLIEEVFSKAVGKLLSQIKDS